MILKPLSNEISVTSADTVSDSKLVRVYAAANAAVTINDISANTSVTFTVPGGSVEIIEKAFSDTIEANTTIACTPISYKA